MADISISLIRRCKAGDEEAFTLLLSKYEGYLYRLCFSYLRNKEDALDVMQEVYIKIFRNIASFDERCQFLPWAKKIAVNSCLNFRRDSSKEHHLSLNYEMDTNWSLQEALVSDGSVEEDVISHTTRENLRRCLDSLPPSYRMVLVLRYLEGMSYQEIAGVLGQPLGTVKNSIFRARNVLKDMMLKKGLLEV